MKSKIIHSNFINLFYSGGNMMNDEFSTADVEKIILDLGNNQKISGLKDGTGSIPCLIVAFGSSYLGRIPNNLKKIMTFFTVDLEWTCNKGEPVDKAAIEKITFKDLITNVKRIVKALKEQYGYSKVGLMGFSAPGLIALQAALELDEEHIAFVIGSGIALMKLDPDFKATNEYFEANAELERKEDFHKDQENFQKLKSGESGNAPPSSNFFTSENGKKRLTPNSEWVAFACAMITKQLNNYKDPTNSKKYADEWRKTPDGKVINETMRLHFFNNILSTIEPEQILEALAKTHIPTFLAFGKDYTTPRPNPALQEKMKTYENIYYEEYSSSIHYPSLEEPKKFVADTLNFFEKNNVGNQINLSSPSLKF